MNSRSAPALHSPPGSHRSYTLKLHVSKRSQQTMIRPSLVSICACLLLAACSDNPSDNPSDSPVPRGATVPWDEYEAEAGVSSGGATLEQTTTRPWLETTLSPHAPGPQ